MDAPGLTNIKPVQVAVPNAGAASGAPAQIAQIAAGARITGQIIGLDAAGQALLRTDAGVLAVISRQPLPTGSTVTVEVRGSGARLPAMLLLIDGKPPPTAIEVVLSSVRAVPQQGTAAAPPPQGSLQAAVARPAGTASAAADPARFAAAAGSRAAPPAAGDVVTATRITATGGGPAPSAAPAQILTLRVLGTAPPPTAPAAVAGGQASGAAATPLTYGPGAAPATAANVSPQQPAPTHAPPPPPARSAAAAPMGPTPATPAAATMPGAPAAAAPAMATAPAAAPAMATAPAAAPAMAATVAAAAPAMQTAVAAAASATAAPPPPGTRLTGVAISPPQSNSLLLNTAAGLLRIDGASLPGGSTVRLEVLALAARPAAMIETVPIEGRAHALKALSGEWSGLKAWLAAVHQADPVAAQRLIQAAIPTSGPRLGAGLAMFIAALRGGDFAGWINAGGVLAPLLDNDQRGLSRIREDFGHLSRLANEPAAPGEWKAYIIPIHDGAGLGQIKMFTRHGQGEGEGEDEKENEAESRLVIEVALSRLGDIQLDGLIHRRRLDLILRSRAPLPSQVRHDIAQIFDDAVAVTGWNGSIGFQVMKEFPVAPLDELTADTAAEVTV